MRGAMRCEAKAHHALIQVLLQYSSVLKKFAICMSKQYDMICHSNRRLQNGRAVLYVYHTHGPPPHETPGRNIPGKLMRSRPRKSTTKVKGA